VDPFTFYGVVVPLCFSLALASFEFRAGPNTTWKICLSFSCLGPVFVCARNISEYLCDTQTKFWEWKKTSQTHENHQATIKTRYCGHLYSPLLRKWTHLDHREWVSHCMEGTWRENLFARKGWSCRVLSRPFILYRFEGWWYLYSLVDLFAF